MLYITFNVYKQKIKRTDTQHIVADSRNYLKASFTFSDDDWTGIKTAIFKNGDVVKHAVLDDNNECLVPWEVIKPGILHVSVFCGDLITADTATVYINESGYEDGGIPEDPSPTVYEQIIAMLNEIETGGIPDDKIAAAVQAYLAEHPVETLTDEDVQRIVSEYVTAHKGELKGDKGDKGEPGKDGITPNLTIGTVETLPSGSDATASITGSAENPVLNLGIPKCADGQGGGGDITTKILIDTLYARNLKNNFAFRDMPTAQCVLILDDCLPSVITTCVNNANAKNVPLNMSAMSEHFNTLTKQGNETVLEAIKRGVANGGEVLLHGGGTINETNIDNEEYLKQKFLDEKELFIENGLNPRGVIVIGGGNEIYGDIRTDRWVRALFDYSDGYGTSEPYYHRRFSPTTLEQAKGYIDSAVANKSFCPIFAHKWYDFWDEMIDYAISKGAVWTTYANVYDTYGTTTSVKAMETRLKVLESASGNVKTLVSINATKTKTSYEVNDTLTTDDITVIATYSDESTADVTSDAVIDASNVVMSSAGSYEIAVSYSGKTTSITITVEEAGTETETVIYQVNSITGTCDGTKDLKLGNSSTQWTAGKQYRYVFDYEVTSVQDAETTVSIRDVNGSDLGVALSNATVGQTGHIDKTINNGNTRKRQAFLLKSYDKSYSVTITNVTVTEL